MKSRNKKIRNRSLKLNATVNTAKTILSLAFPLITFPYVSRVLGVNQIGKFNFANSVVSYFILIASLGISSYAIREGTQYRNNQKKIDEFASEMFTINIISTIISYILLIICMLFIKRLNSYNSIVIILSIEIIMTTLGIEWLYNIYEDFVYIAIRSFVFQCISLVLLFILVRNKSDVDKYALVTVISFSGNNILNWFHAKQYCKIRIVRHIEWKTHLKPILVIFSTTIAITIYVSSDTTMLGFLVNDNNYSVGIYSASTKIYYFFKNIIVAFLVVLIPRFSLLAHEENGKSKSIILFNQLTTLVITIVTPLIAGLIMLAPDVIRIISGQQYIKAVLSFRILMTACLFSFFGYLLAQCILIPNRKEDNFFVATAISAIINICLNFLLIPIIHEVGAAITTLLAEMITMFIIYRSSKKYIDINIRNNDIGSVIIGTLMIMIICIIANIYISLMLYRIVFSVVLSIILYLIILVIMKNSVVRICNNIILDKMHLK